MAQKGKDNSLWFPEVTSQALECLVLSFTSLNTQNCQSWTFLGCSSSPFFGGFCLWRSEIAGGILKVRFLYNHKSRNRSLKKNTKYPDIYDEACKSDPLTSSPSSPMLLSTVQLWEPMVACVIWVFPGKHRIVSTSSQFGISASVFGDK